MRLAAYLPIMLLLAMPEKSFSQLPPDCIELADTVQGPTEADRVRVVDIDGQILADLEFEVIGGRWTLDEVTLAKVTSALRARTSERPIFRLNWTRGTQSIQTDRFIVSGEDRNQICPAPELPQPNEELRDEALVESAATLNFEDDVFEVCQTEFQRWNQGIMQRLGHERYLAVLFGPSGQIVAENKDYGVAGDLIYTAICDDGGFRGIPLIHFTRCDLQSAIPKNPEGDAGVVVRQRAAVRLREYPLRQCFGSSAEITVSGERTLAGELVAVHTIGLYERYRYTLQVGTLLTDQHRQAFGLREDNEDKRVFGKGPIDDGPEYMASIVLYALPRYLGHLVRRTRQGNLQGLEALAGSTYHGRDVVNDHAIADRIGLVFGAGLDDPSDRFVAGLSFEIVPGVNAVGAYEWVKLNELTGVKEGDIFTGTAEEIPTRDVWDEKVVLGVSLDLRYVAGLFKRGT